MRRCRCVPAAGRGTCCEIRWRAHACNVLCLCVHAQGGVKKAVLGTLTFMVGGDQAAFEAAKPYFEVMGQNIVHCGPSGSGQVAKICNNMAMAINMAGCAEAMNLAISQGIDPHIFSGIINSSSGGSWISSVYGCVPDTVEGSPSNNGERTQPARPGHRAGSPHASLLLQRSAHWTKLPMLLHEESAGH